MIITLCGSTKYKEDFERTNFELTMSGHTVISCGVFGHADNIPLSDKEKDKLDAIHVRKILMSDAIMVINPHGHIGKSTTREIAIADEFAKDIIYKYERETITTSRYSDLTHWGFEVEYDPNPRLSTTGGPTK